MIILSTNFKWNGGQIYFSKFRSKATTGIQMSGVQGSGKHDKKTDSGLGV